MKRLFFICAIALAAGIDAGAAWPLWTNGFALNHHRIRTNLLAALDETAAAAGPPAYYYVPPPSRFGVFRGWVDDWDSWFRNVATNNYVNPDRLGVWATNPAARILYTLPELMTNAGRAGFSDLPTNGWMFTSFSNYVVRREAVSALRYTSASAGWIIPTSGVWSLWYSSVTNFPPPGDTNIYYPTVSDANGAMEASVPSTNSTAGFFPADGPSRGRASMRYWDTSAGHTGPIWGAWSFFIARQATASVPVVSGVWRSASLYGMARPLEYQEHPYMGAEADNGRVFDAQGQPASTNGYVELSVAQPATSNATWIATNLVTSAASGVCPNDPGTTLPETAPPTQTNLVWGHAIESATWIIDWMDGTNGFRYR